MAKRAIREDGKEGRMIDTVVLHCSASTFGDAALIKKWHTDPKPKGNGWKDIGYHYVVLNGRRKSAEVFVANDNGIIEPGRAEAEIGAHAVGHNDSSLGVCLIGIDAFTVRQLKMALFLVNTLLVKYELPFSAVLAHNQLSSKACPGFDIEDFRALLMRR